MKSSKEECYKSFWDQYEAEIMPKLKEIDIFMKSNTENIGINEVSDLLYISKNEIKEIMQAEKIYDIDRTAFFKIMKKGTSPICRMFTRELERGLPNNYSPADISYIYDIEINKVLNACAKMGSMRINSYNIHEFFSHIKI
ncbi:MAG: hypothetical protein VB120_07635 [Lachnospiraceae bacterium]|nr:hypothetical protein [Lachnospiraceae bacterium]